jgi:hypothetical protein
VNHDGLTPLSLTARFAHLREKCLSSLTNEKINKKIRSDTTYCSDLDFGKCSNIFAKLASRELCGSLGP